MILLIIVAIVVFVFASNGIKIVRPWQKGLIERLGKYQRTVESGLTMIFPDMERMIKVDMREQVVDVPPQAVITKDNVAVEVDAKGHLHETLRLLGQSTPPLSAITIAQLD